MNKIFIKPVLLLVVFVIVLSSCRQDYSPKRRGFFRIDVPAKEYRGFDTTFPYIFEYPVYGEIIHVDHENAEPYWIDLHFPRFNATIHISYKDIESGGLATYIDDAVTFTNKQIPKATAINEEMVMIPGESVYGMVYHVEGTEVASTVQFFLTDSTDNFLRGALYFNVTPNNDSLAPVVDFLREDVDHLIKSFRWQ